MTREEAKQLLPVIQAYAEGKTIEFLTGGTWVAMIDPTPKFDCEPSKYRIKPELKYRPFKTKEECWEEMHKHPDFGWVIYDGLICTIQMIANDGIAISNGLEPYNFYYRECFMNTKFVDGTPFGIKEN